ncbi:hypothetical protein V8F20_006891 [Naviculisporaceae sp. PSN 640]
MIGRLLFFTLCFPFCYWQGEPSFPCRCLVFQVIIGVEPQKPRMTGIAATSRPTSCGCSGFRALPAGQTWTEVALVDPGHGSVFHPEQHPLSRIDDTGGRELANVPCPPWVETWNETPHSKKVQLRRQGPTHLVITSQR